MKNGILLGMGTTAVSFALALSMVACSPETAPVNEYVPPQISPPAWTEQRGNVGCVAIVQKQEPVQIIPSVKRTGRYQGLSITEEINLSLFDVM